MKHSLKDFNLNQVVGPIDRILRAAIAVFILLVAFILSFNIVELAQACGIVIYFFLTALTRWDPFYALFYKFKEEYKDNAAINGKF